jgi:hypothetical protein
MLDDPDHDHDARANGDRPPRADCCDDGFLFWETAPGLPRLLVSLVHCPASEPPYALRRNAARRDRYVTIDGQYVLTGGPYRLAMTAPASVLRSIAFEPTPDTLARIVGVEWAERLYNELSLRGPWPGFGMPAARSEAEAAGVGHAKELERAARARWAALCAKDGGATESNVMPNEPQTAQTSDLHARTLAALDLLTRVRFKSTGAKPDAWDYPERANAWELCRDGDGLTLDELDCEGFERDDVARLLRAGVVVPVDTKGTTK